MPQRILVVDDDPILRTLEAGILRRSGYEVEEATSGEEALQRLAERPYQAVSVDIALPGIDGCEVVRQLRGRPGPNRDIPAVLVTATAADDAVRRGFEAGAVMFLTKPFAAAVYRAAIASLIG